MKLFLVLSEAYHGKPVIKQNYTLDFDAFLKDNSREHVSTDYYGHYSGTSYFILWKPK